MSQKKETICIYKRKSNALLRSIILFRAITWTNELWIKACISHQHCVYHYELNKCVQIRNLLQQQLRGTIGHIRRTKQAVEVALRKLNLLTWRWLLYEVVVKFLIASHKKTFSKRGMHVISITQLLLKSLVRHNWDMLQVFNWFFDQMH